jgi:hypothetical protein
MIWKMNSILPAVMMIGFVVFLAYLAYDTWLDVKKIKRGKNDVGKVFQINGVTIDLTCFNKPPSGNPGADFLCLC